MSPSSPPELVKFFEDMPVHQYKRKDLILKPDTKLQVLHYLAKGHVTVYSISPQGAAMTIHTFDPGSLFPLMFAFSDSPNRYYFEALDKVEVRVADKEKVKEFLLMHPAILFDVTKRLLMGLDKMTMRLELLTVEKAHLRVISALIYFARHFGKETKAGLVIDYPLTHQEIGALSGLSRETVSREWKKLERAHLVMHKKNIIIPDYAKFKSSLDSL